MKNKLGTLKSYEIQSNLQNVIPICPPVTQLKWGWAVGSWNSIQRKTRMCFPFLKI